MHIIVYFHCSNESWFSVGSYYVGNIVENVTDSIDPAASDVFYILHFDDILNSYGILSSHPFHVIILCV